MSNNLKLINTNTINSKPIRNYIKVKNTGGPKGDTGATGDTGPQGPQGPAGQAATVNIGETTTLLPGQTATVTNTGTQQNATLNFGIPQGLRGPTGAQGPKGDTGPQGLKGDKGNDGAAASVTVGITNTGEPGSNASVTNLGTSSNAILSFTIPTGSRGPQGQTGPQGPKGEDGKDGEKGDKGDAGQAATVTVGSTTTTNPGTNATVTNSGTTSAAVLNFGIPRGATGSVKSEVVAELPETGEGDTFYLVNREATTQTATGKTINFTNSENAGDITDAQIDGETSQNGTPTPSAPIPVQTTTGENVVKICKKNLYDEQLRAGDISQPYANPTIRLCSTQNLYLYPGTYTFSSNIASPMRYSLGVNSVSAPPTGTYPTYIYDSGWTVGTGSNTTTFTINQGGYFSVQLSKVNNAELTTSEAQAYHCQLEFGSIASAYESYQIQSYEVNLGNIELCKIGTYQDYIYKSGGKWYVHKAVGKYTFTGSEVVGKASNNNNNSYYYASSQNVGTFGFSDIDTSIIGSGSATTVIVPVWSSHFDKKSAYAVVTSDTIGIAFNKSGSAVDCRFGFGLSSPVNTAQLLTTWLTANTPTVYYPLATPTDTEITNSALIEQLDNLASAALYSGVNNIFTVTPNEVPTLELDYVTYDKYNQNKVYIYNEATGVWQIIVQ